MLYDMTVIVKVLGRGLLGSNVAWRWRQ